MNERMVQSLCVASIAIVLLGASDASTAQGASVNTLVDAFRFTLITRVSQNHLRTQCGKWFPTDKTRIDHAYFRWTLSNDEELTAVKQLYKGLSPTEKEDVHTNIAVATRELVAFLAPLQARQRQAACSNTVTEWVNGVRNIARMSPPASEKLLAFLEEHSLSEVERHTKNTYSGCIKQLLNNGRDYDLADEMCICVAEGFADLPIEEQLSMKEFAESNEHDAIVAHPSIQALGGRLAHCNRENPSE